MRLETEKYPLKSEVVRAEPNWPESLRRPHRWPWIVGGIILAAIVVAAVLFLTHWPFTQEKITADLQQHFPGAIRMQSFRKVYFPKPGCVAQGVTIQGISSNPAHPMVTLRALTIRTDYRSILTASKRVQILADGLRVYIPPDGERSGNLSNGNGKKQATIDTLETKDAVLEIGKNSGDPLRFDIHHLKVGPIASDEKMDFRADLTNPLPRGEVTANGSFGPWKDRPAGEIPVSGSYRFEHADLGVFSALAGTLTSEGKFRGSLKQIAVDGSTRSPNFEIRKSGHPVNLNGRFHAEVNGTNGDVILKDTAFSWEKTTLLATGKIADQPHEHGKVVAVDLAVHQGRIQDLMRLVMHSEPTMEGPIVFQGHALLPPGKAKFIQRVQFAANFNIDQGQFTKPHAQAGVDKLSERARGDKDNDPERVRSELKGHIVLTGGVAHFADAAFVVPDAFAHFSGTANMVTKQLNMTGKLHMEATLSQATTGVKSFLLKIVDPFFKDKKRHMGTDVPVTMTGTFSHPKFGVSLLKK